MRRLAILTAAVGLAGLPAVSATAQEVSACDRFTWSVKREQAAFAATDLPALPPGSVLVAGTTAGTLPLRPVADVAFPVPPERSPKPGSLGGFVTIPALAVGTYQVTVSDEAWIDVSQDGISTLKPLDHSGQKGCPSVRKSIRFQLGAAPVTIQISGASVERISVALLQAE